MKAVALTWLSLLVMSKKLSLERDFTRFLNDPTFPYKVTVCIGGERILCSGVLLAQQSSVLEKKFREDDGALMFEEMIDVDNKNQVLLECIRYLHGADLSFTSDNIEVILKFASWYNVESLSDKASNWILDHLVSETYLHDIHAEDLLHFLVLSNQLQEKESVRLKEIIFSFLDTSGGFVCYELEKTLHFNLLMGLRGSDVAAIAVKEPFVHSSFFQDWVSISLENKKFVLENAALFDFDVIYHSEQDFSNFVALLSEDKDLMCPDLIKLLLEIQKNFFLKKTQGSCGSFTECNQATAKPGMSASKFTKVSDQNTSPGTSAKPKWGESSTLATGNVSCSSSENWGIRYAPTLSNWGNRPSGPTLSNWGSNTNMRSTDSFNCEPVNYWDVYHSSCESDSDQSESSEASSFEEYQKSSVWRYG